MKKDKIPNWTPFIMVPVLLYGITLLFHKSFPELSIDRLVLWMKFMALSSFIIAGGFFMYYIMNKGILSNKNDSKKWNTKRVTALYITIFLLIMLSIILFTSIPNKESGIIILGIILGTIYVIRGGTLPNWIIQFTQKFNFYTGGTITRDDDVSNLSPKIYLPILLSAILIAIIAFYVFL